MGLTLSDPSVAWAAPPGDASHVSPHTAAAISAAAAEEAEAAAVRARSKATAAAPPGSVVESYHTGPGSDETVGVTFVVTEETEAWCNEEGEVVSFTNLGLSQTRTPDVPERRRRPRCDVGEEVFTGF